MTLTTGRHLIMFPMQMWGHTRTMCTLAARMVRLRNVTVTFFVITSFYDRVLADIKREFLPGEEKLSARVGVIALEHNKDVADPSKVVAAFEAAYVAMLNGEVLVCAKTGERYPPHPVRVSVAVLDMFVPDAFEVVRKHSPGTVKIYSWCPIVTKPFFYYFTTDIAGQVKVEAEQRGVSFDAIADEKMAVTGRVMYATANPAMHDYELNPQSFPTSWLSGLVLKASSVIRRTDGLITFDAADYCPEATTALKAWFAETSRKVYYAGPLIPRGEEDTSSDPRAQRIKTFLDETLESHGEKSVIYFSFGSLFWPTDPSKLWAVLDVLIERNIPFVMSYGAHFAQEMPVEVQERISEYKHAVLADWVPQQALLDHPATGWYLSHGGHNSVLETINAGVPTIVWPICADQPANAFYLAEELDVAYELIEVRNGPGAGTIYRNGRTPVGTIEAVKAEMRDVLDRAFGDDGARKRKKLQVMRKTLQAAWEEDGVGRREVEAFLDEM